MTFAYDTHLLKFISGIQDDWGQEQIEEDRMMKRLAGGRYRNSLKNTNHAPTFP